MKQFVIFLLVGLPLSCVQSPARAQEFKEHISKQFMLKEVSKSNVAVYNLNGFIKVQGYAGSEVLIEADKKISAKDNETLEAGKKELKFEFIQTGDDITVYMVEPYDTRPGRKGDNYVHKNVDYKYSMDFTIKVPFNANLRISTVMNGEITVADVAGLLNVHNVNAGIDIKNARSNTEAYAINGDITISYLDNPPGLSTYHTINGDIKVSYQKDLSADLQFKTMHGDFYTDFPDASLLPAAASRVVDRNGKGTVYKLDKNTAIRIGSGGRTYKFETISGNVYIKKQS